MEEEENIELELEYQEYLKSIITGGELGYWMREHKVDLFGDIDEMLSDCQKHHEGTTKKLVRMEASSFSIAAHDMLLILMKWGKKGGIPTFKDFIHGKAK